MENPAIGIAGFSKNPELLCIQFYVFLKMAGFMSSRDKIHLWRDAALPGGMELLSATCVDHYYPAHHHDEFVIAAFKGGAQKHRIERHVGIAHAGTVMIINPGEVHTGEGAERERMWEYCAYYPAVGVLEQIADDILGVSSGSLGFGRDVLIEDRVMAEYLIRAHNLLECSPDALERQCVIYDALGLLVRRYGQRSRPGALCPCDGDIKQAIDFMNEFYAGPLSVDDIAAVAGLSQYHFMRTFRAKTGLTVHGYLTQRRIQRAKDLLQKGHGPAEVANAVGFFDQSHLNNQFKANLGVTPRQFALACR